MHGPGVLLSGQEANLCLNIDSPAQKMGWVEFATALCLQFIVPQWKAEIIGTLASSAPSCRGDKGDRD